MFSLDRYCVTFSHFLTTGGWVLVILWGLCCILTGLLLERYWFRLYSYPRLKQQILLEVEKYAQPILKLKNYCQLDLKLQQQLPMMRILISLCPLIGLLGTVTGMIQVFDGLSLNQGKLNPQLIAGGIAKATLPTMSGMAIAVFGLIFYTHLNRWSIRQRIALCQQTGVDDYL